MERYILSNGMQVPMIGFCCYTPEPDGYSEVIRNAIEVGFTYFDGASVYGTERQIAKGIKESGVSRKELRLVSKAWTDEMGYRNVREACCRSLDRLETDYLDIYMIHWPKARADEKKWKENDLETWRGMEEKTVPQICLRFLVQKGVMPVTKAGNIAHMRANLDIFDFEIQEEDMWLLSCMPQDAAVDDHPDFSDQTLISDFKQ